MSIQKKSNVFIFGFLTLTFLFLITGIVFCNFSQRCQPGQLRKLTTIATSGFSDVAKRLPKPFVVYSGSMEPVIKTASLILTIPKKSYQKGDVITFSLGDNKENTITHRIEAKLFPDGINEEPVFLTSGDANENLDKWEVTNEQITGKVFFSVPYLGYVVDFAKKPQGFILLVIIPATIIIYEELKFLKNIISRKLTQPLKGNPCKVTSHEPKKSKSDVPKISVLIPTVGALVVFVATSAGFFFDREVSSSNVLSAAESFGEQPEEPTPTPTLTPIPTENILLINEFRASPNPEWVEFYNTYPDAEFLKSYYLDDDLDFLSDSGSSSIKSLATLNTSSNTFPYIEFSSFLNNSGDYVVLFDSEGKIVDQYHYSNWPDVSSIGRDPDGTPEFNECTTATKGSSNTGHCP